MSKVNKELYVIRAEFQWDLKIFLETSVMKSLQSCSSRVKRQFVQIKITEEVLGIKDLSELKAPLE